jgi:hypothetical protein
MKSDLQSQKNNKKTQRDELKRKARESALRCNLIKRKSQIKKSAELEKSIGMNSLEPAHNTDIDSSDEKNGDQ